MITSTLSTYPNKTIVKQLGIVTGCDDASTPMEMTDYVANAIKRMEAEAEKLGADAILGISFALMDSAKPIVIGTAVALEDEEPFTFS